MSNPLIKMAKELLIISEDLPFRFSDPRNSRVEDFRMYTFSQTWGSTALGFGGMGGQMMTTANTYVFVPEGVNDDCFIYFGGSFAYHVPYSDLIIEDIKREWMEPISRKGKYLYKGWNE